MRLILFTKFTAALYELQREMINVSFSEKVNSKTIILSLHIWTRIRTSLSSPPKLFPTQLSDIFIGIALAVSQDPHNFRWIIESLQMLLHCILKTLHLPINTIFTTNGIITSVACSRTDYTGNYIIKISWLVLQLLKPLIVNQNFEIQILRYQWVLSLPLQKAWFNNVLSLWF